MFHIYSKWLWSYKRTHLHLSLKTRKQIKGIFHETVGFSYLDFIIGFVSIKNCLFWNTIFWVITTKEIKTRKKNELQFAPEQLLRIRTDSVYLLWSIWKEDNSVNKMRRKKNNNNELTAVSVWMDCFMEKRAIFLLLCNSKYSNINICSILFFFQH